MKWPKLGIINKTPINISNQSLKVCINISKYFKVEFLLILDNELH